MRYFKSRQQAGELLAAQMKKKYAARNVVVLSLSEGGIVVGAEIAKRLHSNLLLLTVEDITLPRELVPLASMSTAGTFTYNHSLSHADLEEITRELRGIIDQSRLETFQKLNRIVSKDGQIDRRLLKNHDIILVSDGINSGLSLDVAQDFLKPIVTKKTIIATPLCNVEEVDRIRMMTDDLYCLNLIEDGFPLSHYYEDNDLPSHEEVLNTMRNISLAW